jgi:hypothetical protein
LNIGDDAEETKQFVGIGVAGFRDSLAAVLLSGFALAFAVIIVDKVRYA